MAPTGDTKPPPRPMRGSDRAGRRRGRVRPHVRRGEDVERARAQERRADGCFSVLMGRSRWDRPGTPSLPLGRCVVRAGGSARLRGQQHRESLRTFKLLAHGPRNSLWVGVSWHGWLDHDGTDWGNQASPSTEAPFELGRCGRRRPRTHAQEQVFANVTRSGKFHLIPFILTRFFVGCMFPLLMPGLDSSGATEQCRHICSCKGKR